jgi:hypothetical protein
MAGAGRGILARARRAIGVTILALTACSGLAACGGDLLPTATVVGPGATPSPPAAPSPASPRPATSLPGATDVSTPSPAPVTPGPLPPATWARLEPTGETPAAREDHTWTVAGDGGTAYLFGGRDGGRAFDDLWAFDLATDRWTRVSATEPGPEARFGHEAAWIPGRGLAVFAGQVGTRFFDDLWLFDPASASWSRLPSGAYAPVPRYGTCSAVDPEGRLWISHGFTEDGVRFSDTHAYDFEAVTWTDQFAAAPIPPVRCLHACWWTDDGRFALYGGQTTGVAAIGDLWFLAPSAPGSHAWTEVRADLPPARQLAAVARRGSVTIVIGGRDRDGRALDDAWQLVDGATAFVPLGASGRTPPGRSGAALIHDPANDRLLLFGGLAANERADLWSLAWS